ncbi:NAD(P)-binding protein [Laetiporus sulphureus 93-53]|uniref:NAD(P)-binding protein n=1 Tax=Laetiporus sulphureus 93-53 TaxID=1314785 RepID=A0A165CH93_9APHY|nr:NAD(P)-binding protein [Laetiporus sulphureus 93-53]KZT02807.1 NAD(P)-binding protein [Laetiporus sulphureus 93-53]
MGGAFSGLRNIIAVISQLFPGKPEFSPDQIPDLTGQVAIVTGGNTGIGKETVKVLLQHNTKVYMASRNKEKAESAIKELKEMTGREAIFLQLDLSILASIKRAAQEFSSKEPALHALYNNAGVMWCPVDLVTEDGYDLQFGTNVLGHFYFTELLMPALFAGVESSPDHHARVITTASSAAYLYTLNWDTFKGGQARLKMSTENLYSQSKFGNVVVARELSKRYADKGIISISLNPGGIDTELQRYVPDGKRKFMRMTILRPAPWGALTQLWAGTMPGALNHNGKFLIPWAKVGQCRKEAYDDKIGEQLWNWLQEQIKDR